MNQQQTLKIVWKYSSSNAPVCSVSTLIYGGPREHNELQYVPACTTVSGFISKQAVI